MITDPQITTLKAAILAETDSEFVVYRDGGNAGQMAMWLNSPVSPQEDVWNEKCSMRDLDELANYSQFDPTTVVLELDVHKLVARLAVWQLFISGFPQSMERDMRSVKNRGVIIDVFGNNASSRAMLTAATRPKTRAEKILGNGSSATTATIQANVLTWIGPLSPDDVVNATQ